MSTISPRQFREALKDYLGDRVKIHPDWPHATTNGGFDAHGIAHHWTAMGKEWHPRDQVEVLRHGYSGLPGPLCHCAPARNGDLYVIGWGNCNHAGMGDINVYRELLAGRFNGTPRANDESVDGNRVLYGLEYMYHPSDGPMPDEQYETGVLAAAAISDAHGWSPAGAAGSNLDHFEWANRKIDRDRDNLANRTRRDVRRAMEGDFGGIDMNARDIARAVWNARLPLPGPRAEDGTRRTRRAKWVLSQAWNRSGLALDASRDANQNVADLARIVADADMSDTERAELADAIAERVAEQMDQVTAAQVAEHLDITADEETT